jgi:ribosomal protein S19E (S16A)
MELQAMMTGLERVMDAGLVETVADGTVRLTRQGRFLADTVSAEVLTRAGEPN